MTKFRRSNTVSPSDTYLTQPWAIQFLLSHWSPIGETICDPCACGYRGYSIGGTVSQMTGKPVELYDLNPKDPSVQQADFRTLSLPIQSRTIVTNPPFDKSYEFIQWALTQADEVVLLVRVDWFCHGKQDRAKHLVKFIVPTGRMGFWILPEHADQVPHAKRSVSSLTGWTMPEAPIPHGWAVFQRGYTGQAELIVASADKKFNPFKCTNNQHN